MTRLLDATGAGVQLGSVLGRGGEGSVHAVLGSGTLVAKILAPKSRRRATHDKIRTMIARPPPGAYDLVEGFPVLTWPLQLLYEGLPRPDRFVGYTMRRIEVQRDFVPLYQVTSAARRRQIGGAAISWDRLLVLGIRICHVVRTLHHMGYAIGDLNDRNILVSRKFTPLFLDTDSFEVPKGLVGHYPCHVGDRLYWPPELLHVDLASYKASRMGADRYGLAVLLFQLLLNGMRPYQSRGRLVEHLDTLEKKTQAGVYPWNRPEPGRIEPPAGAPDYQALPKRLRQSFEAAFVAGHKNPRRRPSVDDWYRTLKRVNDDGWRTCERLPVHRFARSLQTCPWCWDPNDPFRPPGTRALRRARAPWAPRAQIAPRSHRAKLPRAFGIGWPTRRTVP